MPKVPKATAANIRTVPSGSAGSIGRPSLASAEKGKLLWERIYSKISDRIFLAPAPSE